MNLYLRVLEAKKGNEKAFEDIIKSYEIFTNIQMKKFGITDVESCYSDVMWRIYEFVMTYQITPYELNNKAA